MSNSSGQVSSDEEYNIPEEQTSNKQGLRENLIGFQANNSILMNRIKRNKTLVEAQPIKNLKIKGNLFSKSKWRQSCFKLKRNMILDKNFEFMCTFVTGFVFIIPSLISLVIIYNRFDQTQVLKKHYSDALTPLIIESGIICTIISVNLYNLLTEMLNKGPLVWYRNSFGDLL